MAAIRPRFTPKPIFTLDQRKQACDSGLVVLIQSAGRWDFHYGAGARRATKPSHTYKHSPHDVELIGAFPGFSSVSFTYFISFHSVSNFTRLSNPLVVGRSLSLSNRLHPFTVRDSCSEGFKSPKLLPNHQKYHLI